MLVKLKDDFLWGTSVSSMQTEGAVNEGGKGPSVYDEPDLCVRGKASDWKIATDDYHRYDEDIAMMKEMHFNCYRFSISWSRVFPSGDGAVNEEGLKFYDSLIRRLKDNHIEPMICLYHFDMPAHLARKYNGFASRYVVDAFVRYGKIIIDRYKDQVKYWLTFNEQNIFGWDSSIGGCYLPPNEKLIYQVNHNALIAHARVVSYLHQKVPHALAGGMIAYQLRYPATTLPKDQLITQEIDERLNQFYFEVYANGKYPDYMVQYLKNHHCFPQFEQGDEKDLKDGKADFLSFSYYASSVISANRIPPNLPFFQFDQYGKIENALVGTTEWNWQIDPIGFRLALVKTANRYHLPVFPIENGMGVNEQRDEDGQINDFYRIDYHREHIDEMKRAIFEDGIDCLGYLSWGAIDIISSQGQMKKRYGFVYVNRDDSEIRDLKRIPKKSFYWMQKVVMTNGEDLR
ncbi:glycoside hydrolase family 1 protein [Sporolactobacillus pectinivorans]|uniref:glycoside hydrolase family 1 protein n=1 Tax=Sporolactobacillus pectinivorans TaxID=1591408 RepID=UPI001EFC6CAD|nr:glycoside hydrolase family 1 protein [Sporolactobacillus pectinivorans]